MSFTGVALGCGNFGGIGSAPEFFGAGIPRDEAFAIMDRAWAAGIRWFDTADAYGGGRSESWIGEWRRSRRPDGLVLTTKVFHSTTGDPGDTGLAPDRIRRQLEASLDRLGVERIDLYLAHEPDPRVPLAETVATLESACEQGLVGAWGLSNYDAAGLRGSPRGGAAGAAAELVLAARPRRRARGAAALRRAWDRLRAVRAARRRLADRQVPAGREFPAGSRMTQRPGPYARYVDDAVFDAVEALEREADAHGVDVAALAFAWVLHRVDGAVCGPTRAAHLDPILAARGLALSHDDIERIGGLFP